MTCIFDPLDPQEKYGLILYDYQQTANEIALQFDQFAFTDDRSESIKVLPGLFTKYDEQYRIFFEGKDIEVLRRRYEKSCENAHVIIDISLNRNN